MMILADFYNSCESIYAVEITISSDVVKYAQKTYYMVQLTNTIKFTPRFDETQ